MINLVEIKAAAERGRDVWPPATLLALVAATEALEKLDKFHSKQSCIGLPGPNDSDRTVCQTCAVLDVALAPFASRPEAPHG